MHKPAAVVQPGSLASLAAWQLYYGSVCACEIYALSGSLSGEASTVPPTPTLSRALSLSFFYTTLHTSCCLPCVSCMQNRRSNKQNKKKKKQKQSRRQSRATTAAGSISCRRGQWYWPAINFNVSRQTRTGNVDNAMLLLLPLLLLFPLSLLVFTWDATHVVEQRQRRIQIQQTTTTATTTAMTALTEYQLSNVKCSS